MNQFICIGSRYIQLSKIIEINIDLVRSEHQTWKEGDVECRGYRPVHYVRIITSEVYGSENGGSESACIDFKHGSDCANALITWLEIETGVGTISVIA